MSSLNEYISGLLQNADCKDMSAGECIGQSLFSRIKAFLSLQKIIKYKEDNNEKIKIINNVGILKIDITKGNDTTKTKKPILNNIEKMLGLQEGLHVKISNDSIVQKTSGNSITDLDSINLISHVGFKNKHIVKDYLSLLMKDKGYINDSIVNIKNNTENNNMLLVNSIINKDKMVKKKLLLKELKNNDIYFFSNDDIKFYPKLQTVNIVNKSMIKDFNKKTAPTSLYFVVFNANMNINTDTIPDTIPDLKEGFDTSLNLLNTSALQSLQNAQNIQKPQPAKDISTLQPIKQADENVTYMDIKPEVDITNNILNSIDDDINSTNKINKQHKRFLKLQKKQLKLIKKENKKKERKLDELSEEVDTNETLTRFEEYKMKRMKAQALMVKILMLGVTISLVLVILQKRTFLKYIIPDIIFESLLSIVVVLTIYYLGKAIIDFSNRSTLNFDEYNWHNTQTSVLNNMEGNYAPFEDFEDDIKDEYEEVEEKDELILKFSGKNSDAVNKSVDKLKKSKDIISSLSALGNNIQVDVVNQNDLEDELKQL
jgi:hypothetical protein